MLRFEQDRRFSLEVASLEDRQLVVTADVAGMKQERSAWLRDLQPHPRSDRKRSASFLIPAFLLGAVNAWAVYWLLAQDHLDRALVSLPILILPISIWVIINAARGVQTYEILRRDGGVFLTIYASKGRQLSADDFVAAFVAKKNKSE